jgi:hypothetical protein
MSVRSTEDLRAYACEIYLSLSSKRPTIAKEYFDALSGGDAALQLFCLRHSDPLPDHKGAIELVAEGIVKVSDAREKRDTRKKGRQC